MHICVCVCVWLLCKLVWIYIDILEWMGLCNGAFDKYLGGSESWKSLNLQGMMSEEDALA